MLISVVSNCADVGPVTTAPTPVRNEYRPVSKPARVGEHIGEAQVLVKRMPLLAKLRMTGVVAVSVVVLKQPKYSGLTSSAINNTMFCWALAPNATLQIKQNKKRGMKENIGRV